VDKFVDSMNKVLKYAVDERAAFEAAIDANPSDSTNHLVYADWLDEHGEGDEAAFRRSMGKWLGEKLPHNPNRILAQNIGPSDSPYQPPSNTEDPNPSRWFAHPNHLPEGVHSRHFLMRFGTHRNEPEHAGSLYGTGRWGWGTYRGMESAFRRAFQAGRSTS
jgi:uncharacterized protein (TIGR02996 family)